MPGITEAPLLPLPDMKKAHQNYIRVLNVGDRGVPDKAQVL